MTKKTRRRAGSLSPFFSDAKETMFRKEALDRFTGQEDLDELFCAIPRRTWVSLVAVVLLLAALIVWLVGK